METKAPQRTPTQNNALHRYLELVAAELNDRGIGMKAIFDKTPEVQATPENLKEVWRTFQKTLLGISSTRNLSIMQVTQVWEEMNKFYGENFGVYVPFPTKEQLIEEQKMYDATHSGRNKTV